MYVFVLCSLAQKILNVVMTLFKKLFKKYTWERASIASVNIKKFNE